MTIVSRGGKAAGEDITGKKYGRLTIIERAPADKRGETCWLCRCDCGNLITATGCRIKARKLSSCGCLRRKDLTGLRFGRLVCLSSPGVNKHKQSMWLAQCDCGQRITVNGSALTGGHTRSCGCRQIEGILTRNYRHGESHSETHNIWKGIAKRCNNPAARNYKWYGGRGVRMCARWESFVNFLEDMGHRPSSSHSIDRIDPEKDYSPDNCRWLPMSQQNRNKRNNRMITRIGETLSLAEWAERCGVGYDALLQRLNNGWTTERAFSTPHTPSARPKKTA